MWGGSQGPHTVNRRLAGALLGKPTCPLLRLKYTVPSMSLPSLLSCLSKCPPSFQVDGATVGISEMGSEACRDRRQRCWSCPEKCSNKKREAPFRPVLFSLTCFSRWSLGWSQTRKDLLTLQPAAQALARHPSSLEGCSAAARCQPSLLTTQSVVPVWAASCKARHEASSFLRRQPLHTLPQSRVTFVDILKRCSLASSDLLESWHGILLTSVPSARTHTYTHSSRADRGTTNREPSGHSPVARTPNAALP